MTILQGDIRQYAAQVMLDTDDGGGAMTGTEIQSGASNGIFADTSQLDRTYGRINLSKLFLAIRTATTESYLGAHVIVDRPPADPLVSVTLFSTADWFDRRTAARDKVERYLARGPLWAGHLLESQLEGQRSIQVSLAPSDPVPAVNQGLVLVQDEGKVTEYEQFVRVMRVQAATRKFPRASGGDLERVVATLELSDPLRADFEGVSVSDFLEGKNPRATCRDTTVADATNYYGCQPLAQSASLGSSTVELASILTQLVPSSQAETPVTDVDAAGQSTALVAGQSGAISLTQSIAVSVAQAWYLGSGILPGTLTVTVLGQTATDSGGVLKTAAGVELGMVDYGIGIIRWLAAAGTGTASVTASFVPAAAPARPNRTTLIYVTAANRGFNWITTVRPIPAPGAMVVSYTSQGRVYWLRDNGAGQLKGADSGFGSGTINYVTGTVSLTTGVMPDAGTAILFAWSAPLAIYTRGNLPVQPAAVAIKLRSGVLPNSVTVTWTVLGVSKTAMDNGAGLITGDASGTINYRSGDISLVPALLPQAGTQFSTTYHYGDESSAPLTTATFTTGAADSDGQVTFTVPGSGALRQGGIRITVPLTYDGGSTEVVLVDVPGTGQVVREKDRVVMGTINYATRQITIKPTMTALVDEYSYFSSPTVYKGESS